MRDTRWLVLLTVLSLALLIWGTWHVLSRIEAETRKTLGDSLTTVLRSARHALHD
jgi:hypothetical protein